MTKHIHTAEFDGHQFTRTSTSGRKYSHVIISRKGDGPWGAFAWASRPDLAQKQLSVIAKYSRSEGRIIPCTLTIK